MPRHHHSHPVQHPAAPPPVGKLLSLREVANRLGVHSATLYRYRAEGLPVIYISRRNVKVDEQDLERWLASRKEAP